MLVMRRLFVSYSRKDAEFVGRLTSQLEAWQHDVWVDTDDIPGSEARRASVVEGIGQADAVLLVISPNSMASDNVQRKIAVGAEERRRIIPVLLQQLS
jgi:TIR domain